VTDGFDGAEPAERAEIRADRVATESGAKSLPAEFLHWTVALSFSLNRFAGKAIDAVQNRDPPVQSVSARAGLRDAPWTLGRESKVF
jgi:hypothetical protein